MASTSVRHGIRETCSRTAEREPPFAARPDAFSSAPCRCSSSCRCWRRLSRALAGQPGRWLHRALDDESDHSRPGVGRLQCLSLHPEVLVMEAASVVFSLGWLADHPTVVTTWGIMLVFGVGCWLATRRLSVDQPGLGADGAGRRRSVYRIGHRRRSAGQGRTAAALHRHPLAVRRRGQSDRARAGPACADRRSVHHRRAGLSWSSCQCIGIGIRSVGPEGLSAPLPDHPARSCCRFMCSASFRAPWRWPCACSATS